MKFQKKHYIFFLLLFLEMGISSFLYAQSDSTNVIAHIEIRGARITQPYIILREMSLHVGDTVTDAALEHDKNRIYNLELFNRVELYQTNDTLVVDVVERWYILPSLIFGFQYDDFSKMYYGVGISHQNFRGRNEEIGVSAGFGYDEWLNFNFSAPNITPNDDIVSSLNLAYQKVHNLSSSYGEYENTNYSIHFSLGKRIGLYRRIQATIGYDSWSVDESITGRTLSSSGKDSYPMLALSYRYDTRNSIEYTTDGALVKCSVSKYGLNDRNVNLLRYDYDVRHFWGIRKYSGFGLRSAGSFLGGGLAPPYFHTFFGYNEHIRGHYNLSYEGECLVMLSSELRLPIIPPRYFSLPFIQRSEFTQMRYGLYWAFFADAGKIWYRTQRIDRRPLLAGYGGGFHALLPYSMCIRFETAINEDREVEFYFAWDVPF